METQNNKKILPILIAGTIFTLYILFGNISKSNEENVKLYSESYNNLSTGWYLDAKKMDLLNDTEQILAKKIWEKSQPYLGIIYKYGLEYNVYLPFILSIILQESAFRPSATRYESSLNTYSYGLMQLLPDTAHMMGFTGKDTTLLQPDINIKYGIKYLAYQLNRYQKDLAKTAAAYNAGSTIYNMKGNFINQAYVNNVIKNYIILNTVLSQR